MEEALRELAFKMGFGPQRKKPGINMVVYADDFVISCRTKEQAEQFVPVVSKWLEENVGVELSLEKTKITHIDEGFDFLGFNVRKYDGKLLIKPSKESQLSILRKAKMLLDSNKTAKAETIIRKLNPLLRGWASYYSTAVSTDAFSYCDYRIHKMLWRWIGRRHPNKSAKWMKAKYFARRGNRDWVFTDGTWDLFYMTNMPIIRHTKVQGNRSPFRPSDSNYFEHRRKQLLLKHLNGFQKKIVEKTDGKCGLCGRPISEEHFRKWRLNSENKICFHHVIPHQLGGRSTINNVFVTHRWCHELHYKRYGYDTMPDRPERFLKDSETVINGRVVWKNGSTATDN
ncbi:group II intron maturase-specific domain-containing protein [Alicyclobacillus fastidiosus]|nr:group II intron maturase-specific domain-containing protein [Alicyclobacillus fastidiosus]WEH09021.1 group II intron maturase-specific domain-containing protein [Alicyclobacillus fastidiosus]